MMMTNWEQSSKLILLQLYEKLLKNSMSTILQLFGIWSKLERWKSYISWLSWLKIKKNHCFWSVIFSPFFTQQQGTISWSDCDMWWKVDFVWQLANDQLSGWMEKLQSTSQSQTCTKKRSWLLFGGWLPVWSKLFSTTMPDHMLYNQCFKSWMNWVMKFCLICQFTWPLDKWLPLLQVSQQLFVGKMLPQPVEGRKCSPRVHWIPEAWIFMLQE